MKNRVIWKAILLSIITFGVYGIVWQVKVKGEMNESGAEIPTAWWLIVPIANIWWLWKYSEGVEKVTKGKNSAGLSFALLFLVSIIGQAILQVEFNKIAGPMSKEELAKSKRSTIAIIVAAVLFFVLLVAVAASSSDEIKREIEKSNTQSAIEREGTKNITDSDDMDQDQQTDQPKAWTDVAIFSGSSSKKTNSFTLSGAEAKLVYSQSGGEFATTSVYIVEKGDSLEQSGGFPEVTISGNSTDESMIVKSAGEYYFDVNSANASWTLTVQELR